MLGYVSLFVELLELVNAHRKLFLIIVLIPFVFFILLLVWVGSIERDEQAELQQTWENLMVGDSVFVKDNVYHLEFFKKGRKKLDEYEQRKIKYRRDDTINFDNQNTVPEKYFYKNNTSFVGVCLGKDSTITEAGKYRENRWIKIKPSYHIMNPPKSDKYDYDTRKWTEDSTSYGYTSKLSEDYYVNLSEIQYVNNDSIFN